MHYAECTCICLGAGEYFTVNMHNIHALFTACYACVVCAIRTHMRAMYASERHLYAWHAICTLGTRWGCVLFYFSLCVHSFFSLFARFFSMCTLCVLMFFLRAFNIFLCVLCVYLVYYLCVFSILLKECTQMHALEIKKRVLFMHSFLFILLCNQVNKCFELIRSKFPAIAHIQRSGIVIRSGGLWKQRLERLPIVICRPQCDGRSRLNHEGTACFISENHTVLALMREILSGIAEFENQVDYVWDIVNFRYTDFFLGGLLRFRISFFRLRVSLDSFRFAVLNYLLSSGLRCRIGPFRCRCFRHFFILLSVLRFSVRLPAGLFSCQSTMCCSLVLYNYIVAHPQHFHKLDFLNCCTQISIQLDLFFNNYLYK